MQLRATVRRDAREHLILAVAGRAAKVYQVAAKVARLDAMVGHREDYVRARHRDTRER
jgi:hypothetical protein